MEGIWDIGSLANGASVTLDLPALVVNPTRPTPPSAQTNSAEITVAEPDPRPANNKATATETPQYADLEVHKVTDKYQPQVGEDVTYTITLHNNGPDTAKNVELRDTIPPQVAFKSAIELLIPHIRQAVPLSLMSFGRCQKYKTRRH